MEVGGIVWCGVVWVHRGSSGTYGGMAGRDIQPIHTEVGGGSGVKGQGSRSGAKDIYSRAKENCALRGVKVVKS